MSGLEQSGSTFFKPLLITSKGLGDSKTGSAIPSDIMPGGRVSQPSGIRNFRNVDERSGLFISK